MLFRIKKVFIVIDYIYRILKYNLSMIYKHPLDQEYWVTQDGRKLYPAKGDMTHSHLRNTMFFIQKQDMLTLYQRLDNNNDTRYNYIEKRIKRSKLWHALEEGLRLSD
jgi:hypothetical protein